MTIEQAKELLRQASAGEIDINKRSADLKKAILILANNLGR